MKKFVRTIQTAMFALTVTLFAIELWLCPIHPAWHKISFTVFAALWWALTFLWWRKERR